uniref:GatB_N domain-containing protein n=1 Tax=Macrostomum lignano TaxID=282301 RepID=A0A1I8FF13_9PLAT
MPPLPGTLPVLNKPRCVELDPENSLALNCRINDVSAFDRKHYFYAGHASLPALANHGRLEFYWQPDDNDRPRSPSPWLTLCSFKQDSGRSLHDLSDSLSLIDLNRAGVALMDVITRPTLTCGAEAAGFVRELVDLLRCLGAWHWQSGRGAPCESTPTSLWLRCARAIDFEVARQACWCWTLRGVINETRALADDATAAA